MVLVASSVDGFPAQTSAALSVSLSRVRKYTRLESLLVTFCVMRLIETWASPPESVSGFPQVPKFKQPGVRCMGHRYRTLVCCALLLCFLTAVHYAAFPVHAACTIIRYAVCVPSVPAAARWCRLYMLRATSPGGGSITQWSIFSA